MPCHEQTHQPKCGTGAHWPSELGEIVHSTICRKEKSLSLKGAEVPKLPHKNRLHTKENTEENKSGYRLEEAG